MQASGLCPPVSCELGVFIICIIFITVDVAWDLGKLGKIQSGRKKSKVPQDRKERAREDVYLYFRFFAMADF